MAKDCPKKGQRTGVKAIEDKPDPFFCVQCPDDIAAQDGWTNAKSMRRASVRASGAYPTAKGITLIDCEDCEKQIRAIIDGENFV